MSERVTLSQRVRRAVQAFSLSDNALIGPVLQNYGSSPLFEGRGNQFVTYRNQVTEAWRRWTVQSQYGNIIVRTVLQYWVSWVSGNGAAITSEDERAEEYAKDFCRKNPLDSSLLKQAVLTGLVEGQSLFVIVPDAKDPEISKMKVLRWGKWGYEVNRSPMDFDDILNIEFTDSAGKKNILPPETFELIRLDSFDNVHPTPPIAPVLTPAVFIDQALADWRDMDRLWGSLGMHFESPDIQTSKIIIAALSSKAGDGWKIGDTSAYPAKAYFPEPTGRGQQSIESEIATQIKAISGYTGIGPHLLGYTNLLANRSTSEEVRESATALTSEWRERFQTGLACLMAKAYKIDTGLDAEFNVTIAPVSNAQIKELMEVWAPLEQAGYISKLDVQERIPGLDPETTHERLEAQAENDQLRLPMMGNPADQADDEEDDEEDAK